MEGVWSSLSLSWYRPGSSFSENDDDDNRDRTARARSRVFSFGCFYFYYYEYLSPLITSEKAIDGDKTQPRRRVMAARRRRIVKLPVNFLSPFFTHPLLIPSHPQPPTPPPSPILCSRYRALRGAICRRVNDWTIITFFFIVVRRQSGTERPIYTGRMRHRYARPSPPGTGKTRNSAVRAL